ncbi:PH domain-containing protein [Brachybacterium sp.]|uniref:PH domain-containing protein n=1 Tax=Brachybacterium sp. TaxID=1891286 RepID=UPI002ED50B9E
MPTTIRSNDSRINFFVGPLVILIGIGGALTAVILSIAMQTAWFLMLFIPALLGVGGGLFILWIARRARLVIDDDGFRWCGFLGAEQSLRWEQVHQLLPPPANQKQTVLVAQLHDRRQVPVRALWTSQTSPAALLGAADHSEAQNALLDAHRAWLAARR